MPPAAPAATTASTATTGDKLSGTTVAGETTDTTAASGSGGAATPRGTARAAADRTSPAPVINSFATPESIDCHNGMLQNFTASWSTTNASKVTISIDGPGIYDTYGPSGEVTLPFNCSSSHTFLLTAYNADGAKVTKSVTLQPRNVQGQGSEDDTEDTQP